MKKILTLILSFLLIPQLAIASHAEDLKNLIDEHWYFVTVEWDQQNRDELLNAEEKLSVGFNHLLEQGLTDRDLSEVLNLSEESLAELKTISPGNSEALQDFIVRHQSYLKGSSWNGEITGVLLFLASVGTFLALFTVYAVSKNRKFNACVEAHGGNEEPCIER